MTDPQHHVDWRFVAESSRAVDLRAASPRRRMHLLLAGYAALLVIVLGRAMYLELTAGPAYRQFARAPVETCELVDAERGRILDRNGTILALDYQARALAVHYRYLQKTPDPRWLRRLARERLTRAERRDPARLAEAETAIRDEIAALHRRLARDCGLSDAQWSRRTARIEWRVERLAEVVNRRRKENFAERTATIPESEQLTPLSVLTGLFAPPERLPPAEIAVAEQTAFHRVVDQVPAEVAERIAAAPAAYPGIRVIAVMRRHYPEGSLAANVLGHVSARSPAEATQLDTKPGAAPKQFLGIMGIEAELEDRLAGRPGAVRRLTDRHGTLLEMHTQRRPAHGRDVTLSLDARLQGFAEQLLDRFSQRRQRDFGPEAKAQGGAALVMDVRTGELLAAASQPRFDPNWFATGDPRIEAVLNDPGRPLFDRAFRMEIPPGSVFKPLVAMALLEHGIVRPETRFTCQGYLHHPERMRCQLYRHHGIGHGDVTLIDALAQSCNVYFFHHARELGAEPLRAWARRFAFGQSAGHVPDASELETADALQAFAIGQGTLTATPLQVLRMYAAIANGGTLVEPALVRAGHARPGTHSSNHSAESPRGQSIPGLAPETLATIGEGLERVVNDPAGTAFESVRLTDLPIAGKTGTAETGDKRDHAWFAGYAPANAPRYAFVVVLEHGGSGATEAGTIARYLVEHLRQLGYLELPRTASDPLPHGRG